MTENQICQKCSQNKECKKIYQILGNQKGPSVVLTVIAALLLPLVVFITSLTVFEGILQKAIGNEGSRTALALAIALAVTSLAILIIKAVNKKFTKNK